MTTIASVSIARPLQDVAEELGRSFEEYGFAVIRDHGIPQDLIDRAEADAACFRRVADIVAALEEPRLALVLSACRGVTDALLNLVTAAEGGRPDNGRAHIARLQARHAEIATELLGPVERQSFLDALQADCGDLERLPLTARRVVRKHDRQHREQDRAAYR